jgi:hypothetical protein
MSANQLLVYLPTVDAARFLDNVDTAWVPGTTLAIDLVFPAFPTNLGHWAEILQPMLSALQDGRWTEHVQFPDKQRFKLPGVYGLKGETQVSGSLVPQPCGLFMQTAFC